MDEDVERVESVRVRSCVGRLEEEEEPPFEVSKEAEAREVRGWTGSVATDLAEETESRR